MNITMVDEDISKSANSISAESSERFLFAESLFHSAANSSPEGAKVMDESNIWSQNAVPSNLVFFIYALLVPILAAFGVFTNLITAVVFMRPRMSPSAFTYLAALSWMDCISCLFLLTSTLANTFFIEVNSWRIYDTKFQIPLSGITSGSGNLILVAVTLDRLLYIKNCAPHLPPRFCRRKIARGVVMSIIILVVIMNLPFFFIYRQEPNGSFITTQFFQSTYYVVHNWICFLVLGLFPLIFLMIANGIMLSVIRKWSRKPPFSPGVCLNWIRSTVADKRRNLYQKRLTMTIVAVIFLYIFGELPSCFATRRSSVALLFGGDINHAGNRGLETFRIVEAVCSAFELSLNIVFYATFNPVFISELFDCLKQISDRLYSMLRISIFSRCINGINEIIFPTKTACKTVLEIPKDQAKITSDNTTKSSMTEITEICMKNGKNENVEYIWENDSCTIKISRHVSPEPKFSVERRKTVPTHPANENAYEIPVDYRGEENLGFQADRENNRNEKFSYGNFIRNFFFGQVFGNNSTALSNVGDDPNKTEGLPPQIKTMSDTERIQRRSLPSIPLYIELT